MKYIFGNTKMYLTLEESVRLAGAIKSLPLSSDYTVALFPTALAFGPMIETLQGTSFALGAQNVAWAPKGAYSGAISAELYKEAGAAYALVGHSERRYIFGETNADVRKKVEACFSAKITPVVCIGETLEDKEKNTRALMLSEQIKAIFEDLNFDEGSLILAYEPVWAISSASKAEACTPSDVEDVHAWIQAEIQKYTQKRVPILYGGSVNSENIVSYMELPQVDGVLVGNASTKPEFWQFVSQL